MSATISRINEIPGTVSGCDNSIPSCQHEVQFYFDDRFLIRSLAGFCRDALAAGRPVVVVATNSHRESLAVELERSGVDLPAAVQQGRFVALDAAETLAQISVNGTPDESLFNQVIGNVISCSGAVNNNLPVFVFGEMVTLLWQRGDAQAALRLEQLWNELSHSLSFRLRCGYPIASFDREVHTELFSRICGEHQVVIPAEDYTVLSGEDERLRAIARLQQSEQVLKTESAERRVAQARALEVRSQNEHLLQEISRRETVEDELRRFTRRLMTARDEEQRRIAAELHENTAQLLAALSLYFGVLQEEKGSLNPRLASVVASSRSVSENLLSEIRKLSHLLHPPTLDDVGLSSALREYVDQFTQSSGAKVDLQVSENLGRFSRGLEITVFRIIEESLAACYLQTEASMAVRVTRSPSELTVEVQHRYSASAGFEGVPHAETRIMGIHERVMEFGGTVRFESDRSGTLLSVKLPTSLPDTSGTVPPQSR